MHLIAHSLWGLCEGALLQSRHISFSFSWGIGLSKPIRQFTHQHSHVGFACKQGHSLQVCTCQASRHEQNTSYTAEQVSSLACCACVLVVLGYLKDSMVSRRAIIRDTGSYPTSGSHTCPRCLLCLHVPCTHFPPSGSTSNSNSCSETHI